MSSFLCFICHNTVSTDTNEDTRDKYREIVGMNVCPDSHLCYICCHMLNKLWLFKSICLKRSLEYPVLFSEKGTINLHRTNIKTVSCSEDTDTEACLSNNIYIVSHLYIDNRDQSDHSNEYTKLENDLHEYLHENTEKNLKNTGETENEEREHFDNGDDNFGNDGGNFGNGDDNFVNGDEDLQNDDKYFGKVDEDFGNGDDNFEDGDEDFGNGDETTDDINKEVVNDLEYNVQSEEEDETNYEEERNECLDEIRNKCIEEKTVEETSKKKKSSKHKSSDFEKILLSTEEQKAELEAQRRSKKYIEAEFKCYNCASGFLFKDTYQAHMMRHEESNGEYQCMLCSLRFATGAVLRSHTSLHSVRYRCSRCSEYIRARQTKTHAKHCHGNASAATCHLCGRVFQDASGLQQHLRRFHKSKTSNRTYSCSVCGKSYNNQAAVRTHMIKHVHRKFNCDQCSSIFSSPYTLNQHKKKHTTEETKEHYCSTCEVGYSSRKSLLAHLRQSANHQQRTYECPICFRWCPNSYALASHTWVHSATKQFRCNTCNARYSTRKSLVSHARRHTMPGIAKLHQCHLCGNTFKGKSKLNRHLREVCEKDKLEEELSSYYAQHQQDI